jgi:hypothetical protein
MWVKVGLIIFVVAMAGIVVGIFLIAGGLITNSINTNNKWNTDIASTGGSVVYYDTNLRVWKDQNNNPHVGVLIDGKPYELQIMEVGK